MLCITFSRPKEENATILAILSTLCSLVDLDVILIPKLSISSHNVLLNITENLIGFSKSISKNFLNVIKMSKVELLL